ncbi:hypothetical protein Tco_0053411 [Tanacetum coccineum]
MHSLHETEFPEMCLPLRRGRVVLLLVPGCEVGESSAAGAARQEEIIYSQLDDARYNRALLRARSTGLTVIGLSTEHCPFDEEEGPTNHVPLGHGQWMPAIIGSSKEPLKISEGASRLRYASSQRQQGPLRSWQTAIATRGGPVQYLDWKWHQEEGPQEPRGQGQSPRLPHQSPQLPHQTLTNDVAIMEPKVQENRVVTSTTITDSRSSEQCCDDRVFPDEADKIEEIHVGGRPDPYFSSVVASKPKTMQEAVNGNRIDGSGEITLVFG